jgi:hypothetical protein
MDLLAIMGRGIQRLKEDSDPTKISSWELTQDLEVCDAKSAHLPIRVPADDENPFCMVGGGELNLLAGMALYAGHRSTVGTIVCAYGHRSDYLASIDAPSESEVMRHKLGLEIQRFLGESSGPVVPDLLEWKRDRIVPGPSNTGRELLNVFDLALDLGLKNIGIVTVGVHVPRTATYVAKYFSVHEKYRGLLPIVFESEEVLLHGVEPWKARAEAWGRPRVETLRASKSFARNWAREADGIQKIVRDVYGDAKPKVAA